MRSSSLEAEALASANLGLAGHQAGPPLDPAPNPNPHLLPVTPKPTSYLPPTSHLAPTPAQAGDLEGARACLHRHMQLAEALRGGTSAEAYAKLAQLERDAGQIEVRGRVRGGGGPDRGGPYPFNPNP